jgi:hypothetical protein
MRKATGLVQRTANDSSGCLHSLRLALCRRLGII